MKLDKEPIYAHLTSPSRPDSHFFTYDNITVETAWKVDNDMMGEDKRNIVSEQDLKKCDNKSDSFLTREKLGEFRNVPSLHSLVAVENSIDGEGQEHEDPYDSNSDKESEKETEFYTDKNVTELELPELMVCFQEFEDGDYHAVKDICIDDGFHSRNTKLVENDGIHNNEVFSPSQEELSRNPFVECDSKTDFANKDRAGNLSTTCEEAADETLNADSEASIWNRTNPFAESERKTDACDVDFDETLNGDSVASIFSVTNPFLECDGKIDLSNKFEPDSAIENEEKDLNENVDNESQFIGRNPFLECDGEEDDASSEKLSVTVLEDSDEKPMPETIPSVEEIDASNSPESSSSSKHEDHQLPDQEIVEEDSAEPFTHSAEITTDDIDSPLPATSGREEEPEIPNSEQPEVEPSIIPIIEEETEDIRTASERSLFIQNGFGETSFSAVGPLSGPLVHSGRIPFSGSISHRSDSSTTSTRSFAFPILNTEWNTSPVKWRRQTGDIFGSTGVGEGLFSVVNSDFSYHMSRLVSLKHIYI